MLVSVSTFMNICISQISTGNLVELKLNFINFMSEQEIYLEGMTVESITTFNPFLTFDSQSPRVGIIELF